MDTSPRASTAGYLRVSDADRDSALAELSEHFQAGRLTAAELDERTGQALSARTWEDLAGLMADLPPPGRRGGDRRRWPPASRIPRPGRLGRCSGGGHRIRRGCPGCPRTRARCPVPVVADPVRLPRPAPAGPEHGSARMHAHWRPWV